MNEETIAAAHKSDSTSAKCKDFAHSADLVMKHRDLINWLTMFRCVLRKYRFRGEFQQMLCIFCIDYVYGAIKRVSSHARCSNSLATIDFRSFVQVQHWGKGTETKPFHDQLCTLFAKKEREMSEMISRFSFPFEVIHKPTVIDIDGFNEAFLSGIYHFHIVNIIFKLCENKIERKSKRKSH